MENKLIYLSLEEITPYENNPRNNENAVDSVAASIKEFGFKSPIIVDKNNVIINGHTRYLAAKQLGLSKVPVIIAEDLTEEQVKAFRLADNKVAEIATWDFELLNEELAEIDEIDMSQFGFEESNFDFDEQESDEPELTDSDSKKEKEIECPFCGEKIYL
jgi:ParB/RepB/Spo0J family partition protein